MAYLLKILLACLVSVALFLGVWRLADSSRHQVPGESAEAWAESSGSELPGSRDVGTASYADVSRDGRQDRSGNEQKIAPIGVVPGFHFERLIVPNNGLEGLAEAVVVGDVTGDGRNDVVLLVSYSTHDLPPEWGGPEGWGAVRIYEQGSDGALAAPREFSTKFDMGPGGLELVDLNGDGVMEIAAGTNSGLIVFSKSGESYVGRYYPGQRRALYLGAVDADGDGFPDVFAQSWSEGAEIYLSDGNGGIRATRLLATEPIGYNTVVAADYTGDGIKDLVVTNGQGWAKAWVYPSARGVGMSAPIVVDLTATFSSPIWGIDVADMDRDGVPDLVVTDEGDRFTGANKGVRVLYRGVGGSIAGSTLLPLNGSYMHPGALAVADLDGNGIDDVVVMLNSSDRFAYFLQGNQEFAAPVFVQTDDNPWTNNFYKDNSFAIADVNSDGCPDVVLAELSSFLRIFYGRGCALRYVPTGGVNPARLVPGR